MQWLKKQMEKFKHLSDKKKMIAAGIAAAIIVLISWIVSKFSSSSEDTTTSSATKNNGLTTTGVTSSTTGATSSGSGTTTTGTGTTTTATGTTTSSSGLNIPTVTRVVYSRDYSGSNDSGLLSSLAGLFGGMGTSKGDTGLTSAFGSGIAGTSNPFGIDLSGVSPTQNSYKEAMGYTTSYNSTVGNIASKAATGLLSGLGWAGSIVGGLVGKAAGTQTVSNYDKANAEMGIGVQHGVFADYFGGLPVGFTEARAEQAFAQAQAFDAAMAAEKAAQDAAANVGANVEANNVSSVDFGGWGDVAGESDTSGDSGDESDGGDSGGESDGGDSGGESDSGDSGGESDSGDSGGESDSGDSGGDW